MPENFEHIEYNSQASTAVIENLEVSREILDLYVQGNEDAFRFLYKKYSHRILKFSAKILGDEESARDVLQDVFIKVYNNRNQFNGTNFKAWVYTIAKNCCVNVMRNNRPHDELIEDIEYGYTPNHTDPSLKSAIDVALSKLSIEFREVIILKDYEDYSYNEIVEILNIDLNLVKVRLFRARAILRKLLEPIHKEMNEYR